MASTGIQRKIDDLGRIVIPVGVRRGLGITEGDRLEVTVEGDRIVLAKPLNRCMLCSSEDRLVELRGRNVCEDCVHELHEAMADDASPQLVVLDEPVAPKSRNAW